MSEANAIKILKIGTKVKFGPEAEFKGEITGVNIREHYIDYEISFWKDSELKTIWLTDKNFSATNTKTIGIGFIN